MLAAAPASAPPAAVLPAPSAPQAPSRLWMMLAVGNGILALVVLAILLWPKGADKGSSGTGGSTEIAAKDTAKRPAPEEVGPETAKDKAPEVFIDEDFRSTYGKRAIPGGWEGDAFRVIKVDEEACLEVSKTTTDPRKALQFPRQPRFVTLPPVKLGGDFYIEGAFIVEAGRDMLRRQKGVQQLTIRLENRNSDAILAVVIDQTGAVWIGEDACSAPPSYKPFSPTKFLVTRRGTHLSVVLNGEFVGDKDLREATEFQTLLLGLTEGGGGTGECRLYRVKVATLGADGSPPTSSALLPKGPAGDPKKRGKK
jgi:hypothetical protein